MNIEHSLHNNELTVRPQGRLDSAGSEEFSAFLEEHFTAQVSGLTLDLAEVDFVSSKGLRAIVAVYKSLSGRTLTLVNANPSVREVLRLSGLTRVLNVQ